MQGLYTCLKRHLAVWWQPSPKRVVFGFVSPGKTISVTFFAFCKVGRTIHPTLLHAVSDAESMQATVDCEVKTIVLSIEEQLVMKGRRADQNVCQVVGKYEKENK